MRVSGERQWTRVWLRLAALAVVALVAAACGSREVSREAGEVADTAGSGMAAEQPAGQRPEVAEGSGASVPEGERAESGRAQPGGDTAAAEERESQQQPAEQDSRTGNAQPEGPIEPAAGEQPQSDDGGGEVRAAGRTGPGITGETIRVGNITSYSGPLAGQFDGAPQGAAAYFRMRNEAGGWRGRQFEFVTVDDGADSTQNRAQAQRLVEDEEVFALVGNAGLAEWGSASYLREQGVPVAGSHPSSIGCEEPNQLPCTSAEDWTFAAHNDKYLCEEGILNDVALFWIAVDESRQQAAGVRASLEHFGCEVVYEFEAAPAQPDYTPAIAQARTAGADSVFSVMEVFSNARLRRDMFRQGWEPPYFGFVNYDQRFLEQAGPAAEGSYGDRRWAQWLYTEDHPSMRRYMQRSQRYFPDGNPEDIFAVFGWVTAKLFVEEGLEQLGDDITREGLLDALYQVRDWTADDFAHPMSVYPKDRVEGGQPAWQCGGIAEVEEQEFVLESRRNCADPIEY